MNTNGSPIILQPLSTSTTPPQMVGRESGGNQTLPLGPLQMGVGSTVHNSPGSPGILMNRPDGSIHNSPLPSQQQQSLPQHSSPNSMNSQQSMSNGGNEDSEEKKFMTNLHKFMEMRGSPIEKIPIFDHKELNLYKLYNCVTSRGGLESVIEHKLWRQITNDLSVDPERTDAGYRLRIHYLKFLYPYERKHFLKSSDDENFDFDLFEKKLSKTPADKKMLHRKKKLQQQLILQPPHSHHHNNNNSNSNSSQQSNSHLLTNLSNPQPHFNSPSSGKTTPESSSPNALLSSNNLCINNNNNNQNNSINSINNSNTTNHNISNSFPNNEFINQMNESSFLNVYNSSILSSPLSPSSSQPLNNNNNNNNSNTVISPLSSSNLFTQTSQSPSPLPSINQQTLFVTSTTSPPTVNLQHLEFKSLKKYNNYHKLKVSNTPSKKELLNAVLTHFVQQKIDTEEGIINNFLKRIRSDVRVRQVERV